MSTKNHDFFARRNLNRAARKEAYNNATNPIDKSYKGFKKAIINNNTDDYNAYMTSYKHILSEKDRLSSVESDLHSLKTEINEIKNLLINLNNH